MRDAGYIPSAGADAGVIWGGLLEIVVALAGIGTAVVLYPVVKRQSQALALGFVGVRVLEAATILSGVMIVMSLVTVRQAELGAGGLATGQAMVALHSWTFLLGQGFIPGVNAVLLGSLLYRSCLVPRILPMLGFIGAPLLLTSVVATLFGFWSQVSPQSALLTIPVAAWEFSLGVYLIVKGFKPSLITAGMATADPPPATPAPALAGQSR